MRRSAKRHTLAVLRTALGFSQEQMSKLIDRATSTVQAIELGRLPLIESLAEKIARETAVNLQWLLENDVSKPIIDGRGNPYTKSTFDQKQAWINRKLGDYPDDHRWTELSIMFFIQVYSTLAIKALKSGKFTLFNYKASKALEPLGREFSDGRGIYFDGSGGIFYRDGRMNGERIALNFVRELFKTARQETKTKSR
jgi:transcriptional regulator with XRE-family HTH domain